MGNLPAPESEWLQQPQCFTWSLALCLSPLLSLSFSCVQIADNLKNSQDSVSNDSRKRTGTILRSLFLMSTFGKKEGREGGTVWVAHWLIVRHLLGTIITTDSSVISTQGDWVSSFWTVKHARYSSPHVWGKGRKRGPFSPTEYKTRVTHDVFHLFRNG